MITFIAFVLTILGCVNWLLIGLLQYDFIAGLFGFQASMFSRIVYIIFGVAASYLVLRVIVNKGSFKVWEKKKKGTRASSNEEQANQQQMQPAYANVEAGQEAIPQNDTNFQVNQQNNQQPPRKKKKWWQFWKRSDKKKKKNDNPTQDNQNASQNNMPPVDIDISMSTTPQNFNKQPSQHPAQDNLFDEHFTH